MGTDKVVISRQLAPLLEGQGDSTTPWLITLENHLALLSEQGYSIKGLVEELIEVLKQTQLSPDERRYLYYALLVLQVKDPTQSPPQAAEFEALAAESRAAGDCWLASVAQMSAIHAPAVLTIDRLCRLINDEAEPKWFTAEEQFQALLDQVMSEANDSNTPEGYARAANVCHQFGWHCLRRIHTNCALGQAYEPAAVSLLADLAQLSKQLTDLAAREDAWAGVQQAAVEMEQRVASLTLYLNASMFPAPASAPPVP